MRCIILRGITGSGKTTKAREIVGRSGVIHSTDQYFIRNGRYQFDGTKLWAYHEMNLNAFKKSIEAGRTPVIVDNCNYKIADFIRYVEFAREHGYAIDVIEMPKITVEAALTRTSHGVPRHTIDRMVRFWEPYPA